MKRIFLLTLCLFIINSFSFSQVLNDSQIINPDNEIYTELNYLQMDSKVFFFTQNTPISVAEMKFYLSGLDYENLSDYSKNLYDTITEKLNNHKNLLKEENVQFNIGAKLNIEGYYKSNNNIPWTNGYYYKDNLLTIPVQFGFGDLFSITSDLFVGKNLISMQKNNNFTNIPLKLNDFQFMFPDYAYGSFGKSYEKWGYNLHIGRKGKTIGNTITGSILYNSTFDTDCYTEFVLYSDYVKYTCDVVQVSSNRMDIVQGDNVDRYMYIHQYDFKPFKKLKISLFEGSLICNPFSLRYLNPLSVMHQFGGWSEYNWLIKECDNEEIYGNYTDNTNIYRETNFCAYFASMIEFLPISNLRIYGIYNQVELQTPWERGQKRGKYVPNSFGAQLGGEYNLILKNDAIINFGLEGVYTSPYMYIKPTPSSSLYRFRNDMESGGKVYSWIGTPFGPDCIAGQFKMNYKPNKKWNIEFDYLISAKGQKDFDMFDYKKTVDAKNTKDSYVSEKKIYKYYPTLRYYLIEYCDNPENDNLDDVYKDATSFGIGKNSIITNQFCIQGSYKFTEKLELSGKVIYELLLNSEHIHGKIGNGVECSLAFSYLIY